MERDRSSYFVGKLLSKRTLSTEAFQGEERAKESALRLSEEPELKHIPRAREIVIPHELEHALLDPEVMGRIEITIISLGVTFQRVGIETYLGFHLVRGEYIPEGRERSFEEMRNMALGIKEPSLPDRLSVLLNTPSKTGHKPEK